MQKITVKSPSCKCGQQLQLHVLTTHSLPQSWSCLRARQQQRHPAQAQPYRWHTYSNPSHTGRHHQFPALSGKVITPKQNLLHSCVGHVVCATPAHVLINVRGTAPLNTRRITFRNWSCASLRKRHQSTLSPTTAASQQLHHCAADKNDTPAIISWR